MGGLVGAGLGYGAFRTDCSNCARDDLYSNGGGLMVSGGVVANSQRDAGGDAERVTQQLNVEISNE